ncbi:RIIa domain-containing protein 1 isoform X2 [Homo sapiens]|uniref:RIIa domain-containing protein 1 isoform X2 n=1 Tax=Homo sapiens TaxID=9606 RepID=UPI001FB13259|nr:RIIa domain-containing protein 1 isoform X2 [Homo sapiens]XP_054192066.1 RIIa domain-containing protein 1 isoform X2 [Homo sapiens]
MGWESCESEDICSRIYESAQRIDSITFLPSSGFHLKWKIQTRIANEKYLRTHKEVEWLISGFFRNSFQEQPGYLRLAAVGTAPDTSFPFLPCSCQGQRNIFEKTRQHPRICCRLLHGSKTSQQDSHAAN